MERMKQFTRSLRHAFRGLAYALQNEKNFQNELIVAVLVIIAMIYFEVIKGEAIVLLIVIMAVLIMELLNTAVERMVDILKPKIHPYAKLVKDLMAASVLLMSFLAIILGLIIFIPYIVQEVQAWKAI
ncbi:MAG: diacylglycerol kinase family protein [Candidatus Moranbacteria bacterium]|nr:diacylglycerol kinase family protein [Candidatus Moranbacteria bacterium]